MIREIREPIAAVSGRPERRTKLDWAAFLQDIASSYPDAERITLVTDNLNTHTPSSLYEAFAPQKAKALRNRFEFVCTPQARQLAEHGRD